MLEFNNRHIFTGYLKQLLADFNLPKYKVYTQEQQQYFEQTGHELNIIESVPVNLEDIQHKVFENREYDENLRYIPYIKDNQIQIYTKINGTKQWLNKYNKQFFYNSPDGNYTKKFIIKNNIYDSYTHKYLGDYLRFQRDYNNINLMPLYNCFGEDSVDHLQIKISTKDWYYEKVKSAADLKNNTTYKLIFPLNRDLLTEQLNVPFEIQIQDVKVSSYTGYGYLPWIIPLILLEDEPEQLSNIKPNTIRFDNTINPAQLALIDKYGQAYTITLPTINDAPFNKTFYLVATFTVNMEADNLNLLYSLFKNNLYKTLAIEKPIIFDSSDKAYKIYSVPVKLFNNYTIAIDCESQVEFCCGVYNKYQDTRPKFDLLESCTYYKANKMYFSKPILFDKLNNLPLNSVFLNELATNEEDLKLFIKLPANNNSSIVVLEGNYLNWNDTIKVKENLIKNKSINNCDWTLINNNILPITSLQLLKGNTNKSYPFSDRLIEYLSGNVISNVDTIGDNIVRVQKTLEMATNSLESNHPKKYSTNTDLHILGLWDNQIQAALYSYATTDRLFINKNCDDILGYCDKDIEENYTASIKQIDGTYKDTTIANIDIYNTIADNIYDEK